MSNRRKPCTRAVSKGRYAANIGKKMILFAASVGFIGIGLLAVLLTLDLIWWVTHPGFSTDPSDAIMPQWPWIFGGVSLLLLCIGGYTTKKAVGIDAGVPLTRANTAALLAPDSLVRASQEPAQAQAAILLRAATDVQDRHEEQLLRAATGEQA